jgi:hypothetical protein
LHGGAVEVNESSLMAGQYPNCVWANEILLPHRSCARALAELLEQRGSECGIWIL